jgi:hypothetical protein
LLSWQWWPIATLLRLRKFHVSNTRISTYTQWFVVHKRTISTELPPHDCEVSAKICW